MSLEVASLKVDGYTFHITKNDNFSTLEMWRGNEGVPCRPALLRLLRKLFSLFEKSYNLKIINWEICADTHSRWNRTEDVVVILVNHEPKEKARVVHLPEFEPDARL